MANNSLETVLERLNAVKDTMTVSGSSATPTNATA